MVLRVAVVFFIQRPIIDEVNPIRTEKLYHVDGYCGCIGGVHVEEARIQHLLAHPLTDEEILLGRVRRVDLKNPLVLFHKIDKNTAVFIQFLSASYIKKKRLLIVIFCQDSFDSI